MLTDESASRSVRPEAAHNMSRPLAARVASACQVLLFMMSYLLLL